MDYGAPSSYLVLAPGTPVVCKDGNPLGTVLHVLADDDEDVFDGIVIDHGGHRFVDADQVDEVYERAVVLNITSAEAAQLPEPRPAPAVMEHHGVEDSEGSLSRKLHRAWDRISGNY